jgi:hypothetical protein
MKYGVEVGTKPFAFSLWKINRGSISLSIRPSDCICILINYYKFVVTLLYFPLPPVGKTRKKNPTKIPKLAKKYEYGSFYFIVFFFFLNFK